jgi:hypothetical protein
MAHHTCPESGNSYSENGQCFTCQPNCLKCQSKDKCTKCAEGFYLLNNECVSQCPPNFLKIEPNQCQKINPLYQILTLASHFPLLYLFLASILTLCILKMTCCKKISLTMALLTTAANIEAVSIGLLCFVCIKADL